MLEQSYSGLQKYANLLVSILGIFSVVTLHFWIFAVPASKNFAPLIDFYMFTSVSSILSLHLIFSAFLAATTIEIIISLFFGLRYPIMFLGRFSQTRSIQGVKRLIRLLAALKREKNSLRIFLSIGIFSFLYLGPYNGVRMILYMTLYSAFFYGLSMMTKNSRIFTKTFLLAKQIINNAKSSMSISHFIKSIPYWILLMLIISMLSGIFRAERVPSGETLTVHVLGEEKEGSLFSATENGLFFFVPDKQNEIRSIFLEVVLGSRKKGEMLFVPYAASPLLTPSRHN